MDYTATRLTIYALLSSLEQDLRELILLHFSTQKKPDELLDKIIHEKCYKRFMKDYEDNSLKPNLEQLLYYADFQEELEILNSNKNLLPTDISKYLNSITPNLTNLTPIRNRVAHVRPLNFNDFQITYDTVEFLVKENVYWKNLFDIFERLKIDSSFILGIRIPTHEIYEKKNHNLPLPDFDETGFIGRQKYVDDIIKKCLGPYPVITIVGDGGIGKTTLALKVAYEILDHPNNPFDAIVWTSSKTMKLTPHEIIRIEGAICSSLGIFKNIAQYFSNDNNSDPFNEIIEYLGQFKILLILDNLETIIDDRIRDFLEKLPMGSKILVTSRIGLGAFEIPVKLLPFDTEEAIHLLRTLSKIKSTEDLVKMDNKLLKKYCDKMKNNPGYIKWFVTSVQAGKRPEEVIDKSNIFLEFCMSNVYDYLSKTSKNVLKALLCFKGKRSQAELAFLTNIETIELQKALHQLLSTNMVSMYSTPISSSFESKYELSDLSAEYLMKYHRIETEEYKILDKRYKQLIAASEQIKNETETNPYSKTSIKMRSKGDLIVAKYLLDAFYELKKFNNQNAFDRVEEARKLAPEYFEVHRCDAWINAVTGNIASANKSYEVAIELEPNYAPLRYWYGRFLLRNNETEEACNQFKRALKLAPNAYQILIEYSRACLYSHNFTLSRELLDKLLSKIDLPLWERKLTHDLNIQFYHRQAEHFCSQKNYLEALTSWERFQEAYITCPNECFDNIIKDRLNRSEISINSCVNSILKTVDDPGLIDRANKLFQWLNVNL